MNECYGHAFYGHTAAAVLALEKTCDSRYCLCELGDTRKWTRPVLCAAHRVFWPADVHFNVSLVMANFTFVVKKPGAGAEDTKLIVLYEPDRNLL